METGLGPFLVWGARLLGSALVGILLLVVYRAIRRRSPRAGALVAAGIVIRGVLASSLFFVSYLDLPLLRGIHSGDGFWSLAFDARLYFRWATGAYGVEIGRGARSPAYVEILSHWMQLVGVSPASGALLNLCCYLAIAWIIVRVLRRHEPVALAALAAFTFSPALLVFGTQSLKDIFFGLLLVVICTGAWALLRERPGGLRQLGADLAIALGVGAALQVAAGVRAYVPVFVALALTLALVSGALWPLRPGTWRRLGRCVLVLLLVNGFWLSGRAGQMAVARAVRPPTVAVPGAAVEEEEDVLGRFTGEFDRLRSGFTRTGGNTNLGGEVSARGVSGRLAALGYGLLLTFVPFSALVWAGVVPAVGRRVFIAIADVDTIFMDCSLAVLAVLLFRRTRGRDLNVLYALFAGLLALSLTVFLAYVVTNYGTLFRLRLMAAASFWMLALAVQRRTDEGHA